jgi:oxygen-independent coproporphyrinogen-3 oxidase
MTENLKNSQLIFENIFLSLRTYQGLNLNSFKNRFGREFISIYQKETDKLINLKLAEIQNDYFRLTEKGMLVCDEILPAFATD